MAWLAGEVLGVVTHIKVLSNGRGMKEGEGPPIKGEQQVQKPRACSERQQASGGVQSVEQHRVTRALCAQS